MSVAGLCACLSLSLSLAPGPAAEPAKPGVLVLLAEQPEYKAAKPRELIYVGVLQRNPGSGKIGAARFNPYRLIGQDGAGKQWAHELYVPAKAHLLTPQLGQRVRLIGKLCSTEVDGKTIQELWPARLEPISTVLTEKPAADGIFARCGWQPEEARHRGKREYVFRNGQQLAQVLKLAGNSVEQTATALLAQSLGVPEIDWKKHMVVCVAAGLRGPEVEKLTIASVSVKEGALVISYRLQGPSGSGFGFPAETVLVERYEGPVRIVEDSAPKPAE